MLAPVLIVVSCPPLAAEPVAEILGTATAAGGALRATPRGGWPR